MVEFNIKEFKKFINEDWSYITQYYNNTMFPTRMTRKWKNFLLKFPSGSYRFVYHNGINMYVTIVKGKKTPSDYWEEWYNV